MKIATVFLVAVTVFASLFLESSSTPLPFLGGLGKVVTGVSKTAGKAISGAGNTVVDVLNDVDYLFRDIAHEDIEPGKHDVGQRVGEVENRLSDNSKKHNDQNGGQKLKDKNVSSDTDAAVKSKTTKVVDVSKKHDYQNEGQKVKDKNVSSDTDAAVKSKTTKVDDVSKKNNYQNEGQKVKDKKVSSDAADADTSKTEQDIVGGSKNLNKCALKKLTEKEIKTFEAALAAVKKTVEDIEAKGTDAEKKAVTQVNDWLKNFVSQVAEIPKKMREDVMDPKNREKLINELIKAIEDTKTKVPSLMKTQGEKVKKVLDDKIMGTIVRNAEDHVKLLKYTLSTGNSVDQQIAY